MPQMQLFATLIAGLHMGFIEKFLGFSSAYGNGFEALILVTVVTVITGLALGHLQKHHARD